MSMVLATACGDSPLAPAACGPLPQVAVTVGETASVNACFNDANGDALTHAVTSSNSSVATASLAGTLITVVGVAPGNTTVTVTAMDPGALQASASFGVMVPNRAPQPSGTAPNVTVRAGNTAMVDVSRIFSEPDGQALTYTAGSSDAEVAGASVAGSLVTVAAEAKGRATITITASDPGGLSADQSFRLTVPNRPPAPMGTIGAQTIEVGQSATIEVAGLFTDPDGDALTYTATSLIASVAYTSVSGSTVTIAALGPGTTTVTITAIDDERATAVQQVDVTVPQPNRAPHPVGSIPSQEVLPGETTAVDIAAYFTDPDGDVLKYSATSSNSSVARASVSGSDVTVAGQSVGSATIAVTASDPDGLAAALSFDVTVIREEEPPGSFEIDLRFATSLTVTQRAAFGSARARWMAILADTELPDMPVPDGVVEVRIDERTYRENVSVIDDLMIIAAVAEIDGVGGTLGQAGPRMAHRELWLPFLGVMEFDAADMDRMEADGILEAVILHEMGHVLGIGTLWNYNRRLLRNPSLAAEREVDTHFVGARAIRAFDEVGGASYTAGAKVPVENKGTRPGSDDSHWRYSVFGNELMNPWSAPGASPLSTVTIASLADLGYTVRVDLADTYRLPDAAALRAHRRRAIHLGDDVLRIPIEVRDENGHVVGVIRP